MMSRKSVVCATLSGMTFVSDARTSHAITMHCQSTYGTFSSRTLHVLSTHFNRYRESRELSNDTRFVEFHCMWARVPGLNSDTGVFFFLVCKSQKYIFFEISALKNVGAFVADVGR